MRPTWSNQVNQRGQVVLLAAVVLVVALVPLVLAYLQLGYDGDVHTGIETDPGGDAERLLDRAVNEATRDIAQTYEWDEHTAAVRTVHDRLDPPIGTLEQSRLDDGTVYEVSYNDSRAQAWEENNCPGGPDRQFGPCEPIDGIVVQERAGETHVLATAFDITVTTPDGETRVRTVITVGNV